MAWWVWVLIWAVLVLASAGVFFILGRSLWRKAGKLGAELAVAAERFDAISQASQQATEPIAEPAVFTPATQLRQQRILQQKQRTQKPQQSVR